MVDVTGNRYETIRTAAEWPARYTTLVVCERETYA